MSAPAKPRRYPPSLAGTCLRYQVMELLGFGREISPESRAAMQEGSRRHRRFQAELVAQKTVLAVEARVADPVWGVSGRMDAVIEREGAPAVVEFKTVTEAGFDAIRAEGPRVSHWAQLVLYLALTGYRQGLLVVESRDSGRRLTFVCDPDPAWTGWLRARIAAAKQAAAAHRLAEREVSRNCLDCDRWRRCFADRARLEEAVAAHPEWMPTPPLPPRPGAVAS